MKNIILTIVKYIIFAILLIIFLGYLSIKEKLPALFPDDIAAQMKEYSLAALHSVTGKTLQNEDETQISAVSAPQRSIGYEITDFLFLNNRYHLIKKQSQVHAEQVQELVAEYKTILSALANSAEYKHFINSPHSEASLYEFKSFADKLLTEEKTLKGIDVYSKSMKKLFTLSKSPLVPLQKTDMLDEGLTFLVKYYENQAQINMVLKEKKTYLRFVYSPAIFRFLQTSDKIENFFLILDDSNKLVFYSSKQYAPYLMEQLRNQLLERKFPFFVKFNNKVYGITYNTFLNNLTAVYFYPKTPLIQIILNIFLYLLILFFLFVIFILFHYLYKSVFQKIKQKRLDKEQLMTGMMSEMATTLKSTAELTEQVVADSKSNIEMVNKTIEKIKNLPEEEENFETEQEWKILED